MIRALCKDCNCEFMAVVIMGYIACPHCESLNTYVAIYDMDGNIETGASLNSGSNPTEPHPEDDTDDIAA